MCRALVLCRPNRPAYGVGELASVLTNSPTDTFGKNVSEWGSGVSPGNDPGMVPGDRVGVSGAFPRKGDAVSRDVAPCRRG